ncbi:hypothetical protein WA026_002297 [Henosepilachna vigintioctopunctata]|uniref:Uncharacterized protein n=1 Tax=Henosepilachna vigintioctopunctata TaxID=420089 RepID=A0AAW1U3I1_9CUCU
MNVRGFLLFLACILVFLLGYNEALLTTRYGKKNINNEEIMPRTGKSSGSFFVGSRYGKRMAWSPGEEMESSPVPCSIFEGMSCDYTGISNYYRCSLRRNPDDEDFAESN